MVELFHSVNCFRRLWQLPWKGTLHFHLVLFEVWHLLEVAVTVHDDTIVDRHKRLKKTFDFNTWVFVEGLLHPVNDHHLILGNCHVEGRLNSIEEIQVTSVGI